MRIFRQKSWKANKQECRVKCLNQKETFGSFQKVEHKYNSYENCSSLSRWKFFSPLLLGASTRALHLHFMYENFFLPFFIVIHAWIFIHASHIFYSFFFLSFWKISDNKKIVKITSRHTNTEAEGIYGSLDDCSECH